MINKVEVAGIPGVDSKRVINFISRNFDTVEVSESDRIHEMMLCDMRNEEELKEFALQKLEGNTLYIILDNTPENCRDYIKKHFNADLTSEFYSIDNLVNMQKRLIALYQCGREEYLNNIVFISQLDPAYMETVLNSIKKYLK